MRDRALVFSLTLMAMALSSCNAISVRYVDATGIRGTGTLDVSALQTNGTFSIRDEAATCAGKFPSWQKMTVVFPVNCTDGKLGTVTMTRPASGSVAGEGTLQLASGEVRRFVFGR